MKRDDLASFALGPVMVLMTGCVLMALFRFGIELPHNEVALFVIITFTSFYSGVISGLAAAAAALGLFLLTMLAPSSFPAFIPSDEVASSAIVVPLIVIIAGLLRRRLDQKIRSGEIMFRTLVENLDAAFILHDIEKGSATYISPSFERIFGLKVDDVLKDASSFLKVVHPEDRDRTAEAFRKAVGARYTEPIKGVTYRIVRPDGAVRWLAASFTPVADASGKIRFSSGIIQDHTDLMEARQSEQDFRDRLAAVLKNAPVAIFATDKGGITTFRKGKGGSRARVKPDQDVGRSYFETFKDVPHHLDNVRRALAGETFSDRLQVRDGFFEIFYAPLLGEKGEPEGMVGVATDITERHAAEEHAKELSVLKGKFVTVVAHQLRTPLSVVRWNLEALLNEEVGKLKKDQAEFIRVTHGANAEVISRINDFLLAMDIEEGRSVLEKEAVTIDAVWRSVMLDVQRQCHVKGLDCVYEPGRKRMTVEADPQKIRTVLTKLAENAVQYTQKGSVSAAVSMTPDRVRFEIRDTGIGIPEPDQGRVFHRFFRAANAMHARTDASGLGLYIAKHYVEAHGGTIGFTSKEGEGSTFWFELPARN